NNRDSGAKAIYTDGSKTDEGTGSAYCILENYGIIASWQGKLDRSNSVFQVEILAIRTAIEAASSLHRPIKIWTDSNECANQLAKEAITKGDPFLLPKPPSYLKSEIKSAALSIWQDNWDNGETGRSTHDIVPRVSNKPVGRNREDNVRYRTRAFPFIPSIFEHMTTARAEKKEIQFTMPQNVGLPSPGISKLQQCHLNYSG
ncbi:hypothetical protein AVEN_198607-1, partial [Araneus ventricosus]